MPIQVVKRCLGMDVGSAVTSELGTEGSLQGLRLWLAENPGDPVVQSCVFTLVAVDRPVSGTFWCHQSTLARCVVIRAEVQAGSHSVGPAELHTTEFTSQRRGPWSLELVPQGGIFES